MNYTNIGVNKKFKKIVTLFGKEIEIPEEWAYCKFSDIVDINPRTKLDKEKIPYIPMDSVDVDDPHFKYYQERYIEQNSCLSKFQENDILFARITPSTENGKTCIVENFHQKGIVSSELTVLRPTVKVFPKYLYYYVKNNRIRNYTISQMMGTTGRQRVPDSVFKKDLNFELPPMKEQQKIASILSRVDALIETTQECIEKTQKLKKGLMQILLTKGINHKKFKNVNLNCSFIKLTVARKWTIIPLENFIKIDSGDYFPYAEITSKGMAILKIDNVMYGKIDWTNKTYLNKKYLQTKDVILLNKDDIVLALNRPITNDNVKVAKLTNKDIPCILYQRVGKIVIHDTNKIHIDFLYTYLSSSIFKLILNRILIGTDQPYVKTTELLRQKILIPNTIKEQQKIASILSEVDAFDKYVNQIIDIFMLKNLLLNYDIIQQTKLSIFINVYTKILILYKNNVG